MDRRKKVTVPYFVMIMMGAIIRTKFLCVGIHVTGDQILTFWIAPQLPVWRVRIRYPPGPNARLGHPYGAFLPGRSPGWDVYRHRVGVIEAVAAAGRVVWGIVAFDISTVCTMTYGDKGRFFIATEGSLWYNQIWAPRV